MLLCRTRNVHLHMRIKLVYEVIHCWKFGFNQIIECQKRFRLHTITNVYRLHIIIDIQYTKVCIYCSSNY